AQLGRSRRPRARRAPPQPTGLPLPPRHGPYRRRRRSPRARTSSAARAPGSETRSRSSRRRAAARAPSRAPDPRLAQSPDGERPEPVTSPPETMRRRPELRNPAPAIALIARINLPELMFSIEYAGMSGHGARSPPHLLLGPGYVLRVRGAAA